MNFSMASLGLLPLADWLALAWFFVAWVGYALFAAHRADSRASILGATNRERRHWMLRSTFRENRVFDGIVVQNMSTSPSFFASTTILIIGGLLAALSGTDRAAELVREIPFAARTTALVFDLKLVLLTGVFVYAFFRFTWSIRQYTFGALLVAAAPQWNDAWTDEQREAFADRAGGVMGLAAETFNDGLRAYYMSFALVCWFFSPWAFIAGASAVVWVLFRREFHSDVLALLDPRPPV
ncbi:DUF599 domain-containing protein [Ideonella margarita]|uniref:DUF599 domain-containing protein n=1 Tax=Ideonella margarita TaxID=2984191 RepID=A0ABU9C5G4_9BURK